MREGIYLVLITAIISGLANFFNKFGLKASGFDPFQYTTLKNILVAGVLSVLVLTPWVLPKLKKLSKNDWLKLIAIGVIGGSVPFLLFFKGLSLTSAVSASFIHKTLFVWVALLAVPFLKEKVSILQFVALGVLLVGNAIFEGFSGLSWGPAETLIFCATIFWAIESVIAKMVLKNIDSSVLAWARMFFGALVLIGFLGAINDLPNLASLNQTSIGWLVLASVLLTGYVLTWYAGLKRLPATVVASILVLASPITTMLNAVLVTHNMLSADKVFGLAVMVLGLIAISYQLSAKSLKLEVKIQN